MSTQQSPLGSCPTCGTDIPAVCLLIEYDRADGRAAYAECPGCRAVVRPD